MTLNKSFKSSTSVCMYVCMYVCSFFNTGKSVAQSQLTILPNGRVGVNQTAPANRLQITTFTGDPFHAGANGSSGLRLTNLPNTKIPTANPSNKVLSVDANGDVILVTDNTGAIFTANNGLSLSGTIFQLGGNCGSAASAALTSHRELPMAGFNFNYTMPANSPSQMLIGLPACSTTVARVAAANDFYSVCGAFVSTRNNATETVGLFAQGNNNIGNSIGVNANATSNTSAIAVNGSSMGSTSTFNIAVNGNAINGSVFSIAGNFDCVNSSSPTNIGIQNDLIGGTNAASNNTGNQVIITNVGNTNIGGSFNVTGATTNNYGVFANAGASSGTVAGPNFAGFFAGDVVTTASNILISDIRLKKDVKKIEKSLEILNKLNPVGYNFDLDSHKNLNLSGKKQYGFISQEIKEILPELTSPIVYPATYDSNGKELTKKEEYLGLNYNGFIAIIVDAVKSQQSVIEKQQKQIDELTLLINSIATTHSNKVNPEQKVDLSNKDVVVLNQNTPNPFQENTVITYFIPEKANSAVLNFYDQGGREIKSIAITTKGNGQLSVYANDLSSGLYTYTLVVDGTVVDSKKMVKQN